MVKFVKQCSYCHLDVDIDPAKPLSQCPYCGKSLLYSIDETKQIKLSEEATDSANINGEGKYLPKAYTEKTTFTTAKSVNKYKKLTIALTVVLIICLGYFAYSNIRGTNPQNSTAQNVNYESVASTKAPIQKSTATPTLAPTATATATPVLLYAPPAEAYIGMNYQDVEKEFRHVGFKKFETIALHDMLIDIGGSHIGAVESISIKGNIAYDTKTPYSETDVVRIYYHSLK